MSVRLIWITPDAEKLLGYIARVSNPKNQDNENVAGLLRYMVEHKHWSPFEMVNACFEIETTRDIGRQILRHRSFVFQEFCVAEGTLVTTVTKKGKTKKIPIERLYAYQSDPRMSAIWQRGVRVYDELSKTFVRSEVKEVFKTGMKPCFKVRLEDGKELICTRDHKFFTQTGFARLGDLEVGSVVAVNGVETYKSKDWLAAAKQRNLVPGVGVSGIAAEAGVSYHTIRKWLKVHGLQFSKLENAIIAGGAWNKGLPSEQQPGYRKFKSEETREKMRASARSGQDSELYRNGSSQQAPFRMRVFRWQAKYRYRLVEKFGGKCAQCGSIGPLEIDHIVPVSQERSLAFDLGNLQILCPPCHRKKSLAESAQARQTVRWKEIVSIEYAGERMTYDLEVEHDSHNYVANGIVTHNSQRYADVTLLNDNFVERECRLQDVKNRQNSLFCDDEELAQYWAQMQQEVFERSMTYYRAALAAGVAKEQARALLPEGLTKSRMYMNGTLRSWMHYCQLRTQPETQKEHREIAQAIKDELMKHVPTVMELL